MGLSPALCPAVSTQSLSREQRRFTAPRAEAKKRLEPVLPLVSVYRTGKRFRVSGSLQAHRHNDFLEIRAAFAVAKKARQTFFSETKHGQVASERDPKARAVRLIVGTVRLGCLQRCHPLPPRSVNSRSFTNAAATSLAGFSASAGRFSFSRFILPPPLLQVSSARAAPPINRTGCTADLAGCTE